MKTLRKSHIALLVGLILVFAWSAWQPHDRLTWWLETFPGLAGIVILVSIYRRFQFTTLCYTLIALHICILFIGGHYTYAREPLFGWLQTTFGWQRNHFDRLGHFVQGFVPAIITREIFLRLKIVARQSWLPFLVVCVCLAISASYELIEWWTAALSGDASVSFLATQGDVWDTQKDMFLAMVGATCALLFLSRIHNRAIARLSKSTP